MPELYHIILYVVQKRGGDLTANRKERISGVWEEKRHRGGAKVAEWWMNKRNRSWVLE